VLMRITPLAPRLPYIVVLTASFKTSIDAMSEGLIPDKLPPGPGVIGTPSMTYKGSLSALKLFAPRMRTVRDPSAVRPSTTPATRSARIFSIGWPLDASMTSEPTTFGFFAAAVAVESAPGATRGAERCAQADRSMSAMADTTAAGKVDDMRITPSCFQEIGTTTRGKH